MRLADSCLLYLQTSSLFICVIFDPCTICSLVCATPMRQRASSWTLLCSSSEGEPGNPMHCVRTLLRRPSDNGCPSRGRSTAMPLSRWPTIITYVKLLTVLAGLNCFAFFFFRAVQKQVTLDNDNVQQQQPDLIGDEAAAHGSRIAVKYGCSTQDIYLVSARRERQLYELGVRWWRFLSL
jgi:hypothetical protein